MAIVGAALRRGDCHQKAGEWSRTAGQGWLVSRFLTVCVILSSLSFAGCARNPAQREITPVLRESKAPPLRAIPRPRRSPEPIRYAEPKIRRPDPALLAPQPSPDCEFKRPDLKTVDADEWTRLKIEYERQCYQDAEKAARERLVLLQTSGSCEVESPGTASQRPWHSRQTRQTKF